MVFYGGKARCALRTSDPSCYYSTARGAVSWPWMEKKA
jgi:hypothetical protein